MTSTFNINKNVTRHYFKNVLTDTLDADISELTNKGSTDPYTTFRRTPDRNAITTEATETLGS